MRDLIPALSCFALALFFGWLAFEMYSVFNEYHRLASLVAGVLLTLVAVVLGMAGASLCMPGPD